MIQEKLGSELPNSCLFEYIKSYVQKVGVKLTFKTLKLFIRYITRIVYNFGKREKRTQY